MIPTPKKLVPLEAFCQTCPPVEQVTTLLQSIGFSLDFQMSASPTGLSGTPALPAQYHYQHGDGIEVIFLAGKDVPLDEGVRFPVHQSRWWVYPGAKQEGYTLAIQALASHWFLVWFLSKEVKKVA
jgi:hypothetical protein